MAAHAYNREIKIRQYERLIIIATCPHSLQSLFSKSRQLAGSKVVTVHDGFEVVHGSHAVGKINNVRTARRVLHVAGEVQGNRGKEFTNTVWGEGGERGRENHSQVYVYIHIYMQIQVGSIS